MSTINESYDLTGQLTENCEHIRLDHFRIFQKTFKKWLGKDILITIRELKYKRSDNQNRFCWGVIIPYVRHWLYETQGVKYAPDYVYTWLRLELLEEAPTVMEIAGREVIVMTGKRFSQMNTAEFATAVDTILNKMAERGCIIPEPSKDKNKHNLLQDFLQDT